MRKRLWVYILIGIISALLYMVYRVLTYDFDMNKINKVIFNYGVWIFMLLPIYIYERKKSNSNTKALAITVGTLSVSIVLIWLTMIVFLLTNIYRL